MECPFCKSEMHAEASVCPTCRRDIYLFKPLLARIGDLESQVQQLNAELLVAKANAAVGGQVAAGELANISGPPVVKPSFTRRMIEGLAWFLLPILLLLLTHWLLVFIYDVRVLILRLVVLVIPLPFGFFLARRVGLPLGSGVVLAMVMAALSVAGMSGITAYIDHVPVWPQSFVEWREFVEFALSIAFSAITGMWLGRIVLRMATRVASENWALMTAKRLSAHGSSPDAIKKTAGRLEELANTVITVATTGISIYTGLKGIIGE